MHQIHEYTLLFPDEGGSVMPLHRSQVHIDYDERYGRGTSKETEERLNVARIALTQNPRVFDNPAFRLHGLVHGNDQMTLRIGITSYFEYLAFRNDPTLCEGLAPSDIARTRLLPNAIGNAGFLFSADGKTFAVLRSQNVATYNGYYDLPGGHPDPKEIDWHRAATFESRNEAIREELFGSVLVEIEEDLGISTSAMATPLLLAVLLNNADTCKPDMVFVTYTELSSGDIHDQFKKIDPRPKEVEHLIAFDPFSDTTEFEHSGATPILRGALSAIKVVGRTRIEQQLMGR